jgi:hypothetical protein
LCPFGQVRRVEFVTAMYNRKYMMIRLVVSIGRPNRVVTTSYDFYYGAFFEYDNFLLFPRC